MNSTNNLTTHWMLMFPNPSYERPALSIPPTPSCSTFMRKVRQLRISPSQELEAYRGKPMAVAAFTSETLRYNKAQNLCWFAFLDITAERQVHYPVPADRSTQGTMMSCDSTTCFLSEVPDTSEKLPITLQCCKHLEGARAECLLCSHWYLFTQNV